MKNGFLLTLSVLLIALFGASSRAVEAPGAVALTPTAVSAMPTFIYPKGSYRRFSVSCGMNETWSVLECDAMWADTAEEGWALRLNHRTWVTGYESIRRAHFTYFARRRTLRLWDVAGLGTIRFHSPGRWDVYYRKGRLAAHTRGPQGVAAGFLWLTTGHPS
jgi:hypothetical protein